MRIQFNTGRGYTPNGQRIIADIKYDPYGNHYARFNDIDRGISGSIPVARTDLSAYELKEFVMYNYDLCNYSNADCDDLQWEEKR